MVLWVFCFSVFSALAAGPKTSVTLILNWKPEAEFGGFYSAELTKAFEREGLKVEIVPGGVGTPAIQMVTAGKAEFGISSADEVVISHDRGADAVGLFAVYQTNPQALMVREEKHVSEMAKVFEGGSLAVQHGLPYFMFLEKKWGKPKAKVVPYLGGVAQIAEDPQLTQQCFVTSEPLVAKEKGLKVKTFLVADAGFNPYTALVVVKKEFAQKNPQLVASFRRAVESGWREYLANPEPANALMHKLNPSMDMKTLSASASIQAPLIQTAHTKKHGLGTMLPERWRELAAQLQGLGLVKGVKDPAEYVWK